MLGAAGLMVTRRLLVGVLGWAGTVLMVRELSTDGWGAISFVFGLLGILGLVSDFRIGRIIIRSLLDDDEDAGEQIGSYVALRLLLGTAAYGLAIAIVFIGDYPDEVVHAVAVAGLVLMIASVGSAIEIVLRSRLWFRDITVAGALAQAAQLALIVALVVSDTGTVVLFCIPAVLFEVVEIAWTAPRLRGLGRWRVTPRLWGAWLREAAPLAVGAALATVYFRIDMVLLAELDGLEAVGHYGVAYRFSDLAGAVPGAVVAPLLTILVTSWPDEPAAFARAFRQAFVLLLVAGVGLAIGFAGYARPAIELLFGDRYADVAGAGRALMAAQTVHFVTSLCFSTLVAAGRRRIYPVAALIGVVVNVGLNLVLIPDHSYDGAAVTSIVTEVVVAAVLVAATLRIREVRPLPWAAVGRTVAAGLVMAAVVLASAGRVPWPVGAASAGAAYLAVLHVLNVDGPGGLRALARRLDKSSATVVVSDAERGSAVAVIRSLGAAGYRVVAAATDPRAAGCRSRWTSDRIIYSEPEAILDGARRVGAALIVPVTDAVIVPLDLARDAWPCPVAMPDRNALHTTQDKAATIELARHIGVPVPETLVAGERWPVVVKPRYSHRASSGVTYAGDAAGLDAELERLGPDVLLQEYCGGEGCGVEVLAWEGRLVAAFQHRRLHEMPVTGGPSALRESVPVDPVLLEHSRALMAALGWTGLAMVEFKQGARGPVLMEVNGRIWGSLPLAVRAGMDFPARLARLYLDGPPPPDTPVDCSYAVGVRSRDLELELRWIAGVLRGRRGYPFLPFPRRREAVRAAGRVLLPGDGWDVLSIRDPAPGWAELGRVGRALAGRLRR